MFAFNTEFPTTMTLMEVLKNKRTQLKSAREGVGFAAFELDRALQVKRDAKKDYKETDKFVEDTSKGAVISFSKVGDYTIQMLGEEEGILKLNWECTRDPYFGSAYFTDWLSAYGIAELYVQLKKENDANGSGGQTH